MRDAPTMASARLSSTDHCDSQLRNEAVAGQDPAGLTLAASGLPRKQTPGWRSLGSTLGLQPAQVRHGAVNHEAALKFRATPLAQFFQFILGPLGDTAHAG